MTIFFGENIICKTFETFFNPILKSAPCNNSVPVKIKTWSESKKSLFSAYKRLLPCLLVLIFFFSKRMELVSPNKKVDPSLFLIFPDPPTALQCTRCDKREPNLINCLFCSTNGGYLVSWYEFFSQDARNIFSIEEIFALNSKDFPKSEFFASWLKEDTPWLKDTSKIEDQDLSLQNETWGVFTVFFVQSGSCLPQRRRWFAASVQLQTRLK